jgi:transcriptional regulator CtsR
MRISDLIARYIEEELERRKGSVQLSRSELAEHFNCVPSQINYVLTTRFTPEHGYTVDSRRGGGGYIRITRVSMDRVLLMMHVINAVGLAIDERTAVAFLQNLTSDGVIEPRTAAIIHAAISEADVIFNTVPALIFGESECSFVKNGIPFIELASSPGGIDEFSAKKHGINLINAPALPGKTAPLTAGRIVHDVVSSILRERGLCK